MSNRNYRYYDPNSAKIIIGALIQEPELFETDQAKQINEYDFEDPLHRLTYFTLYNLFSEGHGTLNGALIDSYLQRRPKMFEMFHNLGGYDFVNEAVSSGKPTSFVPEVSRLKKFSLFRGLEKVGADVSFLYDWDAKDPSQMQAQTEFIDDNSIMDLASMVSDRIDEEIEKTTAEIGTTSRQQAGEGLSDLLASLEEEPEMGSPLYGRLINTVLRGARLGKFYLRSSPTGGGKSRAMMADATNFAMDQLYDPRKKQWIENGVSEGSLFISTELDMEECQTMQVAFVTGYEEDKFLDGVYTQEEREVVQEAVKKLEDAPLWLEYIPDFSIQEIERIIRRNVRENGVKYVS